MDLEKILNNAEKELKKIARQHREAKANVKALKKIVENQQDFISEKEEEERVKKTAQKNLKELFSSVGMEFKSDN